MYDIYPQELAFGLQTRNYVTFSIVSRWDDFCIAGKGNIIGIHKRNIKFVQESLSGIEEGRRKVPYKIKIFKNDLKNM